MTVVILRLLTVALVVGAAVGATFFVAGQAEPPGLEIRSPERFIGGRSQLDVAIEAPGDEVSDVEVILRQDTTSITLFTLGDSEQAQVEQESPGRIRIERAVDRDMLPGIAEGIAQLEVTAARSALFGLRERRASLSRAVEIRFEPPRISPVSSQHHISHGGAEMVVFRAAPADVEAGVKVGDRFYPGYAADAAGVTGADASMRVALFALLHDDDLATPISLYARDPAGNETTAAFDYRVFPRTFRRSRIEVGDAFIERVVPAIVTRSAEAASLMAGLGPDDQLGRYLAINRDLRRANDATLASLASQTASRVLWQGPFQQLGNSQVESGFADHRTYFYRGEEVDQQVHLGFDLAVTRQVEVTAANHGTVAFADYLGIYGNTVVVDHGMGLQSLYAHLSSIDVTEGETVERGRALGRSGMTGLAGGDHLHFTILLHGRPVHPLEWWDSHWIEDRIARKLAAASR